MWFLFQHLLGLMTARLLADLFSSVWPGSESFLLPHVGPRRRMPYTNYCLKSSCSNLVSCLWSGAMPALQILVLVSHAMPCQGGTVSQPFSLHSLLSSCCAHRCGGAGWGHELSQEANCSCRGWDAPLVTVLLSACLGFSVWHRLFWNYIVQVGLQLHSQPLEYWD